MTESKDPKDPEGQQPAKPANAVQAAKAANAAKAASVKKPQKRLGWTTATTVDRMLDVIARNRPVGSGDDSTKEELLHRPEATFLNGLSACDLMGLLRTAVVDEAMRRK